MRSICSDAFWLCMPPSKLLASFRRSAARRCPALPCSGLPFCGDAALRMSSVAWVKRSSACCMRGSACCCCWRELELLLPWLELELELEDELCCCCELCCCEFCCCCCCASCSICFLSSSASRRNISCSQRWRNASSGCFFLLANSCCRLANSLSFCMASSICF